MYQVMRNSRGNNFSYVGKRQGRWNTAHLGVELDGTVHAQWTGGCTTVAQYQKCCQTIGGVLKPMTRKVVANTETCSLAAGGAAARVLGHKGLPPWHGSQLAIDTTFVSPLTSEAQPRRKGGGMQQQPYTQPGAPKKGPIRNWLRPAGAVWWSWVLRWGGGGAQKQPSSSACSRRAKHNQPQPL